MARYGTEQALVTMVQNIAPLLMFLLHAVPILISTCSLRQAAVKRSSKLKQVVLVDMVLVAATYITEVGLILAQLSDKSHLTNTASNVYALASLLAWSILIASLLTSPNQPWTHFYGSWAVSAAAEVFISSVDASIFQPATPIEKAQLAMHIVRLSLMVALPLWIEVVDRWKVPSRDEESAPLLVNRETSGETEESSIGNGYGTANGDGVLKPTTTNDPEESEASKKEREDLARIKDRLQEEGSWWSYTMSFSVSLPRVAMACLTQQIFIPYIWPTGKRGLQANMVGVAICIIGIRFLNVFVPRQLGAVFDTLNGGTPRETFAALAMYLFLVWMDSYEGVRALRNWLWIPVENNAYLNLDTASYNHIMCLSADFHDSKQSGELYTAMSQGHSVVQLLEEVIYELLPIVIDLAVACIYFYYLFDAYMALIACTTIVLYLGASVILTNRQTEIRRNMLVLSRKKYQAQYDTMGNWRTVTYFNRTEHSLGIYAKSTSEYLAAFLRSTLYYYFSFGIQSFILDVGLASACFLAMYQVLYGDKTSGAFIVLLTYWANLAGPLNRMSRAHRSLLQDLIDAEQLLQLFRQKPSIQGGPHQLHVTQGRINFNHLHFSYDSKKKTIDDLTFQALPGQKIALIGETGGGKSTILKLLFRFYDLSDGHITIDGQDIKDVTLESLRENIGVVPQDPSLFNDTIMNNVRYARLDATDEEVIDACRDAAIHDRILSFTDGYETTVGEHGIRLSGGELQRVAVARAILKNPKIVLLDEATSSVDSETEAKIQAALQRLAKNRTTFVVAHRLSTIADADLIVVIKDGIILEQGTPATLMEKKGKYYHLWTKQMGIIDTATDDDKPDAGASTEQEPQEHGQHHLFLSTAKYPLNHEQSHPHSPNMLEKPQRPTPPRGSSLKHTHPSAGSKTFRPEAPEFIPSYQRSTVASTGLPAAVTLPSHAQSHDSLESKIDRKATRPRKRKARYDPMSLENASTANFQPANELTEADGDSIAPLTSSARTKPPDDEITAPKRPRFGRRFQARSEPHLARLHDSQADGAFDRVDRSMVSHLVVRNSSRRRRVTAPSDAPSGSVSGSGLPLSDRVTISAPRRRRQRHWRSRNREPSSSATTTSATAAGATSTIPAAAEEARNASLSEAQQDWSSESAVAEASSAQLLFTSPMEGVPLLRGAQMVGGRVRFATSN